MGFFDTLGNLGKRAFDSAVETGREAQEKRAQFSDEYRYRDEELMRMTRGGSVSTRMAAAAALKDRGYHLENREWIRY